MKVNLLSKNKIKIEFSLSDLNDLNISINDFISSKTILEDAITRILDIIKTNCNIYFNNSFLTYNLISKDFKSFILFISITKNENITELIGSQAFTLFLSSKSFDEIIDSCKFIKNTLTNKELKCDLFKNSESYILKLSSDKKYNIHYLYYLSKETNLILEKEKKTNKLVFKNILSII